MHVWTETPFTEIRRQLRYLGSPANVTAILSGETRSQRAKTWPKGDQLCQRAYGIAACIRQADQYYEAAETVALATEPLLQYYGAQALAKAAILASSEDLELKNLRYHGLATRPNSDYLRRYVEDRSVWSVESEFGVTKSEGVFPALCDVIDDYPYRVDEAIKFRDVIGRIPDLMPLYYRHYGSKPPMIKLREGPRPAADGRLLLVTSGKVSHAEIQRDLPALGGGFEKTSDRSDTAFLCPDRGGELPETLLVSRHTVDGREFLIERHKTGVGASVTVLYAGLFVLGNLVRYKPDFWMHVIEGRESGSAAIVEAFCNVAKRRFTNDVLEIIWGERFTYGTPAYLA